MDNETLQDCLRLYKEKKFAEAVDKLNSYLALNSVDITAITYLGAALAQLKCYPEAAEAFLKLTRLDPGNIRHYYNLGQAYEACDNDILAAGAYEKALQIDPDHQKSIQRIKIIETKKENFSKIQSVAPLSQHTQPANPQVSWSQISIPQQPSSQPFASVGQTYSGVIQMPAKRKGKTYPPWIIFTGISFGLLIILFAGIKYSDIAKIQAQERAQAEAIAAQERAQAEARALIESKKIEAWIMAQEFVKDRLKSPSTAKFPDHDEVKMRHEIQDDTYIILSYVESQNSFGAMLRTDFICKIGNPYGDTWRLYDLDFLE